MIKMIIQKSSCIISCSRIIHLVLVCLFKKRWFFSKLSLCFFSPLLPSSVRSRIVLTWPLLRLAVLCNSLSKRMISLPALRDSATNSRASRASAQSRSICWVSLLGPLEALMVLVWQARTMDMVAIANCAHKSTISRSGLAQRLQTAGLTEPLLPPASTLWPRLSLSLSGQLLAAQVSLQMRLVTLRLPATWNPFTLTLSRSSCPELPVPLLSSPRINKPSLSLLLHGFLSFLCKYNLFH